MPQTAIVTKTPTRRTRKQTALAQLYREINLYTRSYWDVQKVRIEHQLRVKSLVRTGEFPTEKRAEEHYQVGTDYLEGAEQALKNHIDTATAEHPVRMGFFAQVSGIGPILSGGFISFIEMREQCYLKTARGFTEWVTAPELFPSDGKRREAYKALGIKPAELRKKRIQRRQGIACFDKISNLWSFAGLGLDGDGQIQRRRKGHRVNYNTVLKTLCWKLGDCLSKTGKKYKREYFRYKETDKRLHPEPMEIPPEKKGGKTIYRYHDSHMTARAKRYVAKLFLSHLWWYWREIEDLPVVKPYICGKDGHHHIKHWEEYLD